MDHQYFNPETKIWSAPPRHSLFNPEIGVGHIIWHALGRNTKKVGQIFGDDGSFSTFGDLRQKSLRVAKNLESLGVRCGDVVTVIGTNNKEIAAVVFDCFFIGAPVNTLDPSFGKDDLTDMFGTMKPKIVVCEESNCADVAAALLGSAMNSQVFIFGETVKSMLLKPVKIDVANYKPTHIVNCSQTTALILCSSGTTGPPKGVCISHAQVTSRLMQLWHMLETDIVLTFSSLYWISSMSILLAATVAGAARVTSGSPISPAFHIELVKKYKISYIVVPPVQLAPNVESPAFKDVKLPSVRLVICGGSFLAEDLRYEFERHFPNGIVRTVYGMTELSIVTTSVLGHKPHSVGQLQGQAMVKIMDDDSNLLGPNQEGHVAVKIPYPFIEYMNSPEQTASTKDAEGWVHTGDLGYFDDDSFLFIVGRTKDIIRYRGYHLWPASMEEFLRKETGIQQVCVIRVEDFRYRIDLPAAVFVPSPTNQMTQEMIHEICRAKLPDYKQFRGGIYFVDKFPTTPSGKIKRTELMKFAQKQYEERQMLN